MTTNLPAQWNGSAQIEGLALVDKVSLLGEPFRIIGLSFRTSSTNGARLVEVDAERADGTTFSFNDSSTGVKEQIVGYLSKLGKDHIVDIDDEYLALTDAEKLVAPEGLRVSEYQVPEKVNGRPTGKMRDARTYYLTTSGERAGRGSDKPAKPATRAAASK